jgi:7-cyano-7-deazaguanine tRNA-ribosyltransferase
MFGLGLPQFFSLAVGCGCDLMDSAAYILFAKEQRYFTLSTGTKHLDELEEFPCHCPICSSYTTREVKDSDIELRTELLAKHNLYLSFSELRTIRQSIREGNLWELIEQRIRMHPNLVKAMNLIKEFNPFIENHEKLYKNHGRLFSSHESFNRPLVYRYGKRLSNNYRSPIESKYLLILPELDIKGKNSPSIIQWMEKANENEYIERIDIHIVFFSLIFGIIPFELIDTFPLGQCESFTPLDTCLCKNALNNALAFLFKHIKNYKKCAILIPQSYINQFGEIVQFPLNHPIYELKERLSSIEGELFSTFNIIEHVIEFFRMEN